MISTKLLSQTSLMLGLCATALLCRSTFGNVIGGPTTNPSNAHIYYLLGESTWTNAEAEAVTLGGHLTTINDVTEQNWVFSTFGTISGVDRSLWIGLREVGFEGNYQWVNGEPLTYTNWYPGEPNNASGIEAYVHMIRTNNGFSLPGGGWNDMSNNGSTGPQFAPFHGVVEVVPEPASFVLAFIGLCAIPFVLRRKNIRIAV